MSADSSPRSLLRDEDGASALEFAMLAPVFIALLFGVFQLGWALHCGATLQYAVEQAARSIMLDPDTTESQLQTQVRATMQAMAAGASDVSVSLSFENSAQGARLARVRAVYTQVMGVPHLATYNMTFRPEAYVPAED